MRLTQVLAIALIVAGGLAHSGEVRKAEIGRTELARRDLGDSIHEVIQVRVDFAHGAAFPKHSHPGVEVAHVLSGSLEYILDGSPPVTLNAGESLFIPTGISHSATNVGSGNASELATYVVEKGKSLLVTTP